MKSARRVRTHLTHSRGQALVEFALVAPIFFFVLLAILEGSRFVLFYEALNNATREGARYAIVHGSNAECASGPMPAGETPKLWLCYDAAGDKVVQRVQDAAFGIMGSGILVTPIWPTDNGRDSEVQVTASYTYRTLVPFLPLPPITVTAESNLVINN